MTCIEFCDQVDALALAALPAGEASEVLRHLDSCADCAAAYASAKLTAERLLLSAPLVRAPAGMRTAVLAAVRDDIAAHSAAGHGGVATPGLSTVPASDGGAGRAGLPRLARRTGGHATPQSAAVAGRDFRVPALAAAAILLAVVGLGAWSVWLQVQVHDLQYARHQASSARAEVPPTPEALATLAHAEVDALMLLSSPATVRGHLGALGATTAPSAAVFWNPEERRCVILARQLAQPEAGTEYHVWFKYGEKRWDGGPLVPDGGGVAETVVDMSRWKIEGSYTINLVIQPRPDDGSRQLVLTGEIGNQFR